MCESEKEEGHLAADEPHDTQEFPLCGVASGQGPGTRDQGWNNGLKDSRARLICINWLLLTSKLLAPLQSQEQSMAKQWAISVESSVMTQEGDSEQQYVARGDLSEADLYSSGVPS